MCSSPPSQTNKSNKDSATGQSARAAQHYFLKCTAEKIFTNLVFPRFPSAISFVFYTQDK
jgi:hypothetical protein